MRGDREAAMIARRLEPVSAREAMDSERLARSRARREWHRLASDRPGRLCRPALVDEDDVDREALACFRDQERCGK